MRSIWFLTFVSSSPLKPKANSESPDFRKALRRTCRRRPDHPLGFRSGVNGYDVRPDSHPYLLALLAGELRLGSFPPGRGFGAFGFPYAESPEEAVESPKTA